MTSKEAHLELRRLQQLKDRYERNYQRRVKRIRDLCPHEWVSYHYDPSGGSDSFYSCLYCGKQSPEPFGTPGKRGEFPPL